ncbi:chymotrypsin BII-like [Culicoides brevitarsis]|uniref:chymotrypsin BII-like n=1 Tax=Culicoides brevitarsis TaxID=469753 RepID=UPI00307BF180
MQKLILLLFCVVAVKSDVPETRIIGGAPAQKGQFPYLAAVITTFCSEYDVLGKCSKNGTIFCGGSIISACTILTAAHCVNISQERLEIEVVLGAHNVNNRLESGQIRIKIGKSDLSEQVKVHQNFTNGQFLYDIAVINLKTAINLNGPLIKSINLTKLENSANLFGRDVKAIGWGKNGISTKSIQDAPYYVDLMAAEEGCAALFLELTNNLSSPIGNNVQAQHICVASTALAAGQGVCDGDYGGPLIMNVKAKYQVLPITTLLDYLLATLLSSLYYREVEVLFQPGIGSFGSGNCIGSPSVFTRTDYFWTWIDANAVCKPTYVTVKNFLENSA